MAEERRTLAAGRYVLRTEPVGSGGMGVVWRAADTLLDREVAVKELRLPEGLNESERLALRERAIIEARAAGRLNHPGIVTIHDVLLEDGRPWIVMGLVEGPSLHAVVCEDGPLGPRRTAEIGAGLLAALRVAHDAGILHRDIKPQNVLLDRDGRAVITDFGIAAVVGATRGLTGTGSVMGTLGYVPPERLTGRGAEPASDLWSLGATLYFAVEGRPAYDMDDPAELIAAVLSRDPAPAERAGPLNPTLLGLMARRPDERPSAELAAERLGEVARGVPDLGVELHAAGATADNRPTIRATPRIARLSGSLPAARSGARARRVSRARIAGMSGIAVLLSAALLSAGYALALARVGDGEAAGGGASGSPSVTVPPSSGSPSAREFTASPNACLYLTDHPQVVARLVPKAKLWAMHKSTNSCSWEPTQKPDGEITRLSVEDPLLPANLGDCPTQGERLPGLGDEGYVSEETDLDAYGWHERDVRVYFRVSNLGVCVKYRTASRASMPPSAKAEVTEFARVLDRWAAQALDDRGN
ncbi:serine/threonine-protein kinase [Micromonospora sp. DSM 115977]|uniref:non-specific serine/threonine protein kinase n=1 Tax=Micromonospora reichwaldensis TaxID=3075516 RepID=A0ABU2X2T6_9ACTN|nr:serine/threonine-protein kinase [Micromonospora sp. DSM 115977]MDT0532085.1 serine/threonine-protein kinase [Micromonospora sp. DSM 115977]